MAIITANKTLSDTLLALRCNPFVGPRISKIESQKWTIRIQNGFSFASSSTTWIDDTTAAMLLNPIEDQKVSLRKYGISESSLEISMAHEIGHIYFDYLFYIEKLDITKSKPANVDLQVYFNAISETTARETENFARTTSKVPLRDVSNGLY